MNENFEKNVAVDGPVVGSLERGQRWTVRRKREAVRRLPRGESVALLSREPGVEVYRLGGVA